MKRALVFGGYGVFGGHVARALAARGVPQTIAGRDPHRADEFARALGPDGRGLGADVTDRDACRAALEGHAVAVNCAGPFHQLNTALLDACLDAGCHYADIADDRAYAAAVRGYDERFRRRGLAAVYGCSSLPGISGALALRAMKGVSAVVERVRVTLFIGNRNPKGAAAINALVAGLGRPIAAPQGELRGFRDREVVSLPPPFGRRPVFNFQSPEYDLFPALLGARAVSVKVGFEFTPGSYAFAVLARLGLGYGRRTARVLERLCGSQSRFGHSGGAVMAELFLSDGSQRCASVGGPRDGQRMAALPCAVVGHAICSDRLPRAGATTAYEFLGGDELLGALAGAGFALHVEG